MIRVAQITNGQITNVILRTDLSEMREGEMLEADAIVQQIPRYVRQPTDEEEADQTELKTLRDTLTDLRDGTGTAGERIRRVEKILFRMAKHLLP